MKEDKTLPVISDSIEPKNKGGRPSLYTDKILEEIVTRLSNGEPLAQICRSDNMPAYRTVWEWQQNNEEVSKGIAHAREEGEDVIAANTRLIARGIGESTNDVQRDKLIIETDLKLLAKWNPKKYGEHKQLEINHTGAVTGFTVDVSALLGAFMEATRTDSSATLEDSGTVRPLLPAEVRT